MNKITAKELETLKEVFIVPSTHWDREWYRPFQEFRFKLVELIEELLTILSERNYSFTFDGQTIILEDFFEIRTAEQQEAFLEAIRKRKIAVGPWYLLPDEWLVGQESLIRNLEFACQLGEKYDIPLMPVGYLPDQFGHTRAIPQILSHLTNFQWAVIWRGVGEEIQQVPFYWKCHEKAKRGIKVNYLPFGYGNAAHLSNEREMLENELKTIVKDLEPFSPVPVYLLMNGTDHQFPNKALINNLQKVRIADMKIKISLLEEYLERLTAILAKEEMELPVYHGEFRSPARAPLLQDTYSTRMWIKLWDNKVEDLLVHFVEPQFAILQTLGLEKYPKEFLTLAWRWLLKNQPHDSICGCSVDQTHNEMISRYSWAESLCNALLEKVKRKLQESSSATKEEEQNNAEKQKTSIIVFNPSNNGTITNFVKFKLPAKQAIKKVINSEGEEFPVQPLSASEEILFESIFRPFFIKTGIKMLPGRKLMDVYLNKVEMFPDAEDTALYHIILICDKKLIGELDTQKLKEKVLAIVDSGKYKRFHVKGTLGSEQGYATTLPLKPWRFTQLRPSEEKPKKNKNTLLNITANMIETRFYRLKFASNGTFSVFDKQTKTTFSNLLAFEDLGDRGDEYTFCAVYPSKAKAKKIKRRIITKGPIFAELEQKMVLEVFASLDKKRAKRTGKVELPITTIFRVYHDNPRIDMTIKLRNTAKDHRLRVCFSMPFKSKKTKTATHFGVIERQSKPLQLEQYAEKPSGIQPQKRFIRIEDDASSAAFTLFNKGLPEVELIQEERLALTLIRAVGYLSRQDFPERPMHAGPFLETPGAQELYKDYTFQLSILTHDKNLPINESYNFAEGFALPPISYILEGETMGQYRLEQNIFSIPESKVKISSFRIKDDALTVLLYNIDEQAITIPVSTLPNFNLSKEVTLDGRTKDSAKITQGQFSLTFQPFELKMLKIT